MRSVDFSPLKMRVSFMNFRIFTLVDLTFASASRQAVKESLDCKLMIYEKGLRGGGHGIYMGPIYHYCDL